MLASVVHPVAILSAVFCVICSLALYVASIVSFCFPHVIDVNTLTICEGSACCFVWIENEIDCLCPCMHFL